MELIEKYADRSSARSYQLQLKHKSLNAATLKNYNEELYCALLNWFTENAYELTKLSFSTGAALEKREWSDFIWYINLLGENSTDDIFRIKDICCAAQASAQSQTFFSAKNGGTTIQLPFGFVQWHQRKLQFRHDYDKLKNILELAASSK